MNNKEILFKQLTDLEEKVGTLKENIQKNAPLAYEINEIHLILGTITNFEIATIREFRLQAEKNIDLTKNINELKSNLELLNNKLISTEKNLAKELKETNTYFYDKIESLKTNIHNRENKLLSKITDLRRRLETKIRLNKLKISKVSKNKHSNSSSYYFANKKF